MLQSILVTREEAVIMRFLMNRSEIFCSQNQLTFHVDLYGVKGYCKENLENGELIPD